ncbi:hypothetical protein EJB05_45808, partial [Eragrostis curvula]
MVSVSFAASAALFVALAAVELFRFLHLPSVPLPSTSTSTQDSTLDRAVESTASDTELFFPFQVLVLLAATVALFAAVAFVHLHPAAAGGATGAGNKRLSELATLLLCGAAGTLNFILFVLQPAAADVAIGDVGALVRALGAAAADALAAAATVTFYLSITLVIAHIRAGGEGGGGNGAVVVVAGHGRVLPAPVYLLKKLALGAAAALLIQMAMALFFK